MGRHPFCVAVFIAHFVTSRHFPNFNGFGAYYSETATPKSTTRQICRGNYTQTGLLQWFRPRGLSPTIPISRLERLKIGFACFAGEQQKRSLKILDVRLLLVKIEALVVTSEFQPQGLRHVTQHIADAPFLHMDCASIV